MLEMLDNTTRIGSTPTFLYLDLYLRYPAYAAHYVKYNYYLGITTCNINITEDIHLTVLFDLCRHKRNGFNQT